MKNISMKKLISGTISLVIIAGMALATFATNLDLEAFVNADDYEFTFHELDFLIDDLDTELERIYKFTCTNVKTFGGQVYNNDHTTMFYTRNTTATYGWYAQPVADFSEEGYLRVNFADAINDFTGHGKTDKWEFKLPANLVKWNDGVEPAPNCFLKSELSRTWPNVAGTKSVGASSVTMTVTMGPFKKFPNFTTAGAEKNQGLICGFDRILALSGNTPSAGLLKYAYNQTEEPTSWSTDGAGRITIGNTRWKGQTSSFYKQTAADVEAGAYTKTGGLREQYIYMYTSPTTDFSQYTNFWLSVTYTYAGNRGYEYSSGFDNYTLTSWNHNN